MADQSNMPQDSDETPAPSDDTGTSEAGPGDTNDAQPTGRPPDLPSFDDPGKAAEDTARIGFLGDVNLHVKVELGRSRMYVEDVLRLNEGSVVELDKPAGDPVDIYVNDRHLARGEVLVVNDNFCVRVSEIIALAEAEEPVTAQD